MWICFVIECDLFHSYLQIYCSTGTVLYMITFSGEEICCGVAVKITVYSISSLYIAFSLPVK